MLLYIKFKSRFWLTAMFFNAKLIFDVSSSKKPSFSMFYNVHECFLKFIIALKIFIQRQIKVTLSQYFSLTEKNFNRSYSNNKLDSHLKWLFIPSHNSTSTTINVIHLSRIYKKTHCRLYGWWPLHDCHYYRFCLYSWQQ